MKRVLTSMSICVLVVILLGGGASAGEKIVLNKYPKLAIGFTTQNFSKALEVNVANTKKLLDFAHEAGFTFVELRDPLGKLSRRDCEDIAAYADAKGIAVAYALQIGLLRPDFAAIFARGLGNAAVFKEGPRTLRTLATGPEFRKFSKKLAWSRVEIEHAVKIANDAANKAKALGLQYVVENGSEPRVGDGVNRFGRTEFFKMVNSNAGLQYDTGNAFRSRIPSTPEEIAAWFKDHVNVLHYIHLKFTKDNETQKVYSDGYQQDLDLIFGEMSKNNIPWVAFELASEPTFGAVAENHRKSAAYLMDKFQ
jgi:sugar phosphate isomerase/epimerase